MWVLKTMDELYALPMNTPGHPGIVEFMSRYCGKSITDEEMDRMLTCPRVEGKPQMSIPTMGAWIYCSAMFYYVSEESDYEIY